MSEWSETVKERLNYLGRGVNATVSEQELWLSLDINPRQCVRESGTDYSNVEERDRGLKKETYKRDATSRTSWTANIRASISEPSSHVTAGVHAGGSHDKQEELNIIGRRVVTRAFAFKASNPLHSSSFETQLSQYLLGKIEQRQKMDLSEMTTGDEGDKLGILVHKLKGESSTAKLEEYLNSLKLKSPAMEEMANDCSSYLKESKITHYIHAIELGAALLAVFKSESEDGSISGGLETKVLEAVDIGIEGDIKRVLSDTGWEISETGAIEKDFTVKRDTEEEAIVGVWLKPVHSLVSSPKIKEALKHALSNYYTADDNTKAGESLPVSAHVHTCMHNYQFSNPMCSAEKIGPIKLYCRSDEEVVFLKAAGDELHGTTDNQKASSFYISPVPEKDKAFYIIYYGDGSKADEQNKGDARLVAIDRPIFWLSAKGPVKLAECASKSDCLFKLHSRFPEEGFPVSIAEWMQGQKFFIKLPLRGFRRAHYISMEKEVSASQEKFVTASSTDPEQLFHVEKMFDTPPPGSIYHKPPSIGDYESVTREDYKPSSPSGGMLNFPGEIPGPDLLAGIFKPDLPTSIDASHPPGTVWFSDMVGEDYVFPSEVSAANF